MEKPEEDHRLASPENESGISEGGSSTSKLDSSNEMKEIREKERLGDDITVVIPDAPAEARERGLDTPRSVNSENTSWSNLSESEGDYGCGSSGEIITAPVRSIIGR